MSNDPRSEPGFRSIEFWVDPPTATVQILVADAAVDTVRRKLAHQGEAVVVLGKGPADPSARRSRYGGSREGWPHPSLATDDAAGQSVDDVAELYRREGFEGSGPGWPYTSGWPGSAGSRLFSTVAGLVRSLTRCRLVSCIVTMPELHKPPSDALAACRQGPGGREARSR
ncbi:MAG: hypothetical protein AB7V44_11105 [Pseudonocardia sp.]